MLNYQDSLASKRITVAPVGFDVAAGDINPALFPFQQDVTRWALAAERAAQA